VSEAPTSKQVSKKKTLKLGEEKANKSKKKQKKKSSDYNTKRVKT
jgi:hypothetical protein